MKRLLINGGLILSSMVFACGIVAAQQQTPPAQESKPEAKKEAPSVAGKWNVSVDTPSGSRASTLDLKVDGKKVTGTMASEMGETPVAGEYADGKLTFSITIDAGGQQLTLAFVGAFKADGTIAGTIDFGQGEMAWTAARAK